MNCFIELGLLVTLNYPLGLENRDPLANAAFGCDIAEALNLDLDIDSELTIKIEHTSSIPDGVPMNNNIKDWRWLDTVGIYYRFNF